MALELEDDVFFADLSKQIALLIMDDEEEFPAVKYPPLQIQEFPYMPQTMMPPLAQGYHEVPYRRESKGTGVFIPRSTINPRRKNNRSSGKFNSINNSSSNNSSSKSKNSSSSPSRSSAEVRMSSSNHHTKSGLLKRPT